jgi:GAF domain-containing protein
MTVSETSIQSAIEQLGQRLEKCSAARECIWALTDAAIGTFALPDCVGYLLNRDRQTLTQVSGYGPKMKLGQLLENAITLRVGQGIVGHVAAERRAIRIDDTRSDPRYVLDDDVRLSELAVPIEHAGTLYGVLDMEHPDAGFYGTQHEAVLVQMASLTGARIAALGDGR